MSRTYCHTHSKYDCPTCADEILSLGIQVDKDRIKWLESEVARLEACAARTVPVEVFDSHCNYASFAGRVCNKCGRIHDGGKSVAVVGEPIYWIDPDDDANLSRISRVGWSPLYGESPASTPAADLARLREKDAEADELREDAELGECIREKFRLMKGSTAVRFLGCLGVNEPEGGFDWSKTALELIDAAIAQEPRHD